MLLEYLSSISVVPQDSVRLVVVTHWHDDHVRGASAVVQKCVAADVAISAALRSKEFVLLSAVYRKIRVPDGSGLEELGSLLEQLQLRKAKGVKFGAPKWSVADRLLYSGLAPSDDGGVQVRVHALSPSDDSILKAQLSFGGMLPHAKSAQRIVSSPTQNQASVVLLCQIGSDQILLGADLERENDPSLGWQAVIETVAAASARAGVLKVPHHGAESGHDGRLWEHLLDSKPIAVLTPFQTGRQDLPTDDDVQRIVNLTDKAYATALPKKRRKYKASDRVVSDVLSTSAVNVEEVRVGFGHVRIRKKIGADSEPWRVELFGDAVKLS